MNISLNLGMIEYVRTPPSMETNPVKDREKNICKTRLFMP